MPTWFIYLFLVVLLIACIMLARIWYGQGRGARWFGERLPGMLGFTALVTVASLAFDVSKHGFDHLIEHPVIIASRFAVVLLVQLVPYAVGYLRARGKRGNGIIGMD